MKKKYPQLPDRCPVCTDIYKYDPRRSGHSPEDRAHGTSDENCKRWVRWSCSHVTHFREYGDGGYGF